jgi:3-oxoacid CoA-transferase
LPLTAIKAVDMIITDLGVFEFLSGVLTLTEIMPGTTLEELKAKTSASFNVAMR